MVNEEREAAAARSAVLRASALLLLAIGPPLGLMEALAYGLSAPGSALGPWSRRPITPHGTWPAEWLDWLGRAWVPALVIACGACLLRAARALPVALARIGFAASAAILVVSLIDRETWSSNVLYAPSSAALIFALSWLLLVAGLSARYSAAPALARFGIPAIAIWGLGELLTTAGWAGGAERGLNGDALGGAIDAAYARLDQPWAAGCALLAATVLALGALAARARAERLALLALGLWAASRGALDLLELRVAQRVVAHRDDAPALLAFGAQALTWDVVSSVAAVALALAAALSMTREREPRDLRQSLALFALLLMVAAGFAIDAGRLRGVVELTSSQTLASLLQDPAMRPMTSARPGGRVLAQVALLHADRSMTLLSHRRTWRIEAGGSLPVLNEGLLLLVDERVPIGELVQLAERLPDDYALALGRIANHLDAGSTTQRCEAAARAVLSVSSQWLTSPRFAARIALGEPTHRLEELPQDRPVRTLPSTGVLVVDQPRRDAVAEPLPTLTTAVPSAAWTLIAWGW